MAKNNQILNNFLNMFKLGISPKAEKPSDKIYPTKPFKTGDKKEDIIFKKEAFPDTVKRLKEWYLTSCHETNNGYKNRKLLWKDMQMLYLNCPFVSRSIKLIADEVVQIDTTNNQPIKIEAKGKQKKFIQELFDNIQINTKIRPTIINYCKYGNGLWVLGLDENGISDITMPDIMQFEERMEFTPYKAQIEMNNTNSFLVLYKKKVKRIEQLIDSITNKDNISSYYKSYLFGYQIGDNVLPPWRVLHFRNFIPEDPFIPYGMPLFINSLAPYRQYDSSMTLQTIARGLRFPKKVVKLNIPNVASDMEKFAKAAEMSNLIQNSGINGIQKEQDGIGEVVISINDLYEIEYEQMDIDLGKIDDLEMLRDDIIISTDIPRNMIDPNDSAFGDSGISLVEKWKPFARLVFGVQQVFLEQLTQLVKIHMIQSKQFSEDEIDFILSMPYPESATNEDLISNQTSLLDLANDIIEAMQEKLNNDEPLPDELIQMIYTKFLPYDDIMMDQWYKTIKKSKDNNVDNDEFENDDEEEIKDEKDTEKKVKMIENFINNNRKNKWKILESKLKRTKEDKKTPLKEHVENIIFEHKQENLREGIIKNKHFYSSRNSCEDFNPFNLNKFDKNIIDNEDKKVEDEKRYMRETILNNSETYKFKYAEDKKSKKYKGIKQKKVDKKK